MRKIKKLDAEIVALISSFFTLIVIGSIVFHYLERWTWVQSAYFTVVTLTTVGYGDLTPTSDTSRIVVIIFILSGISVFASALAILGSRRIKKKKEKIEKRRTD